MTLPEQVKVQESSFEAGRMSEREKIDAIIKTYDEVKSLPGARIPTQLELVIYAARSTC